MLATRVIVKGHHRRAQPGQDKLETERRVVIRTVPTLNAIPRLKRHLPMHPEHHQLLRQRQTTTNKIIW